MARSAEPRTRRGPRARTAGSVLVDLVDGAHEAVMVRDEMTHAIQYWNRGAEALYGWSSTEALGQVAHVLLRTTFPRPLSEIEAELRRSGYWEGDLEHTRKDGSRVVAASRWSTRKNTARGRALYLDLSRDVTDQRRIEVTLRALALERSRLLTGVQAAHALAEHERALFEGVLQAATDYSVIATNPNGVITVFNEGAERMLGYPAEEVVGQMTPLAIHDPGEVSARAAQLGMQPGFEVFVTEARRGGSETRAWTYVRKDGSQLDVQLTVTAMRDAIGAVTGFMGIAQDVTARKRAETERARLLVREQEARATAEAAVRLRDQTLAAVAHDLKNPLTAILGASQILAAGLARMPSAEAERLSRAAQIVRRSATRMVRWVGELTDAARLQIGESLRLDRQPVDLVEMAGEIVAEYRWGHNQVELVAAMPELAGQWDRGRLERVLDNLLTNAVKYSPNGNAITVEVDRDADGTAVLRVRDRGVGIPAADVPRVFEPFHRAGNVAELTPGTGLGLAAVRTVVELHGGTIAIESREGAGTVVTVRLPSAPDANT